MDDWSQAEWVIDKNGVRTTEATVPIVDYSTGNRVVIGEAKVTIQEGGVVVSKALLDPQTITPAIRKALEPPPGSFSIFNPEEREISIMSPSTPERERDARPTDQEVKDEQQSQLQQERDERDARLGIGSHTADGPQPQGKLGDTLREKEEAATQPPQQSEDDEGESSRVTPD